LQVAFFIPGIAGSSKQHYVRNAVHAMSARKFHCVVFNHRGCDQVLHSAKLFTFGDHDDVARAVNVTAKLFPKSPIVVIGFSSQCVFNVLATNFLAIH
jgi:predicted alpha/beta-fold hydrolase